MTKANFFFLLLLLSLNTNWEQRKYMLAPTMNIWANVLIKYCISAIKSKTWSRAKTPKQLRQWNKHFRKEKKMIQFLLRFRVKQSIFFYFTLNISDRVKKISPMTKKFLNKLNKLNAVDHIDTFYLFVYFWLPLFLYLKEEEEEEKKCGSFKYCPHHIAKLACYVLRIK